MDLTGDETRALNEVRDALSSSLDIRQVMRDASALLLRIVGADYATLGVTKPGEPLAFDWVVAEMPSKFFDTYPEMAQHDFIIRSVLRAPNRVLRDAEMIPRRELEANVMYGRARDLGTPIEQVMSALLGADGRFSGGISLLRSERRPFSERDRAMLQSLVPALTHAVRNCRLHAEAELRGRTFEALLAREGLAVIVLSESGAELGRSESAVRLLEKWFCPTECTGGLPPALVDYARAGSETGRLWRSSGRTDLVVRLYSIRHESHAYKALVMEESSNTPSAPPSWRGRLTPREYEIVDRVVRGWDNRLVAEESGCTELTVRTHLKSAYPKLGVETRAQLIILAMRALLTGATLQVASPSRGARSKKLT